jgi:hypothetical protein
MDEDCLPTSGPQQQLHDDVKVASPHDRPQGQHVDGKAHMVPFACGALGPATLAAAGTLDPQLCFDKPSSRRSPPKLQQICTACSLLVAEMVTGLLELYQSLLAEGRSKRGMEAMLANSLRPTANNNYPGLICISPELVANGGTCHSTIATGLYPHLWSPICLLSTSRRGSPADCLGQASSTTTDDIKKVESKPSPVPKHLEEVTAIQHTQKSRVDLFVDIKTWEIFFILWATFLDESESFLRQSEDAMPIP